MLNHQALLPAHHLKYTVAEGKNLIEKDTDFASNGIWTAKDTGTVRIKVTKAEDDKYKMCIRDRA